MTIIAIFYGNHSWRPSGRCDILGEPYILDGILMVQHKTEEVSESEQIYLITIARLIEQGFPEPIPFSDLAKQMSNLPVSVNQMVRKLEQADLLSYLPYNGVSLTSQGEAVASQVLRNRRLWEVFLVDQLQISMDTATTVACYLKHITSDDVAHRLSRLLGEPNINPQDKRIPAFEGNQIIHDWVRLTDLTVSEKGHIDKIETPPIESRFLVEEGLRPGLEVTLKAIGTQGTRLAEVARGCMELFFALTDQIWI